MIDLRRLHVLRAVAHYGTVTAAARALHFTPSAASQQIRQLARDLGVDLLEPQGRGIRLTPAAESLLAHADAIQARWEQAELDLRADHDEPAGPLRVGGLPVAVSALLAPMAVRLRERYRRLTVSVQEAGVPESFDLLFEGEIDLAVVEATPHNPPMSDIRYDQQPLLDDPFDLVVPAGHPLSGRDRVDLADVAHEDWIAPFADSPCRTHVMSACGAAGFTPGVVHHARDWDVTAHLVAHGLGVALIPRLAHLTPDLPITRVRCAGDPHRKLLTCTRQGGHERPAIAAALSALRDLAPTAVA
ncbi:DNA-binding transcriptional LysR family regulator [Streptomyces sp. SAI-208]|jgi:DNA-binding transcriptional LysR family regulator|uniref:LysR family transcriptional regulator n=1 Tax=unclassified Streptomyces TaxID=2593676 RepID=UPI002474FEBD|nr:MULTISPECIES: LysR family transcriptional regulator [unclassified Streptomyces]MDH6514738.1 DNA-binding transcriptional LysR family regulator [Streptomyces sp. SAI-090]MDH6566030.1 DNA-binding transcriptional LysR family regulator [Streptomyces sp. SAI-117]MDH6589060.1 DNA-binding transcriptional LysR family regulator [Streptomyces sp. SAI-133]MDH6605585.1 DNA-binding transcriptional LysR family regulator [Streptomyces sp. SAI-208]MDH6621180.1 DNA-binding transcriptional LysR family regulat